MLSRGEHLCFLPYQDSHIEDPMCDREKRVAFSRLAPNYAEVARVLQELQAAEGGFSPETVLDYGSGCGGAFWAVRERFG